MRKPRQVDKKSQYFIGAFVLLTNEEKAYKFCRYDNCVYYQEQSDLFDADQKTDRENKSVINYSAIIEFSFDLFVGFLFEDVELR